MCKMMRKPSEAYIGCIKVAAENVLESETGLMQSRFFQVQVSKVSKYNLLWCPGTKQSKYTK